MTEPGTLPDMPAGGTTGMRETSRPIKLSAAQWSSCCLGEADVDVELFMHACTEYANLLERLGYFTLPMTSEIQSNVRKIRQTYQQDPSAYRSMHNLLLAEVGANMHHGSDLADPSSAMGLLWARRGLQFWQCFYGLILQCIKAGEEVVTSSLAVEANREVLMPFQGWVSRSSFAVVVQSMPDWRSMSESLAPSQDVLLDDVSAWLLAAEPLLKRMHSIQLECGLEDKRKSF